jgi:hypothetical protein
MYRASPRSPKRIHPALGTRRGAMAILLLVGMAVLFGVGAVALNLTWLTSHKVKLRQACEAAALAGAAQLLDPFAGTASSASDAAAAARVVVATGQAGTFFAANSPAILQTTGVDPDVVAGWCEDPTSPGAPFTPCTGTGPVNSLFVRGVQRRSNGQAVVLWFGRLFGVGSAEPAAAAIATMDQRIYGFRASDLVPVPLMPLLAPATAPWPGGGAGTAGNLADNYSVAPRTGAVSTGADGVAEITLFVPLAGGSVPSGQAAASWFWSAAIPMDFEWLGLQVTEGFENVDLMGIGGEMALGPDGTLLLPTAPAPNAAQADTLLASLLAIRGQKRIWPRGSLVTVGGQPLCQVTGFVGGCVVDCSRSANCLTIVVQACTIQTCTGLLRSGMARNPWIGKLILNE